MKDTWAKRLVGRERFAPYLDSCGGDGKRALEVYVLNIKASARLFELIALAEVGLRNATVHELNRYPGGWQACLRQNAPRLWAGALAAARSNTGRDINDSDLEISHLSFGFWKSLFAARFESRLWGPYLHNLTPRNQRLERSEYLSHLHRIHVMRNRIAHHESIIWSDLLATHTSVHRVIEWLDPQLHSLAKDVDDLEATLHSIRQAVELPYEQARASTRPT